MKIVATNLSLFALSTDLGLIPVGGTVTVNDVNPVNAFKMASSLKAMVDAGRLSLVVSDEAARLDALETLPQAFPLEQTMQTSITTITTAQLLALNTTPITVVPAAPAGFANVFESAAVYLPYNSIVYTIAAGKDLSFRYTDGSGLQLGGVETTGFLDTAASAIRLSLAYRIVSATAVSDITPVTAAPIVLHMLSGNVTAGNSDLHVKVYYTLMPTAF